MTNPQSRFFIVRRCYPRLYQKILESLNDKSRSPRVRVIGAAGVGKSVFMHYFALRYVHQLRRSVLLEDGKEAVAYHITPRIDGSIDVQVLALDGLHLFREDPSVLYLVDGHKSDHPLIKTGVGFFCPRTFAQNNDWTKLPGHVLYVTFSCLPAVLKLIHRVSAGVCRHGVHQR